MNELIHIDQDGRMTARELYAFLELNPSQYSRWAKANIVDNQFAAEGVDYFPFDVNVERGGQASTDYLLTIDFAKKLCMVSKSPKGEAARDYFLEVERRYQKVATLPDFSNPAIAARAWADQYEQRQLAEAKVAELAPKADFFDAVAGSKDAIAIGEAAKVLAVPGIGQNKLFAILRDKNVLMRDNVPYQEYVDRGYFRVIEQKFLQNGEPRIYFKTLVYQRGLDYIRRLLTAGKELQPC